VSLLPATERIEFGKSVRSYLEKRYPVSQVLASIDSPNGFDREIWDDMNGRFQLSSMTVPERFGGLGFSFGDLCFAFREFGRGLMPSPLLSHALSIELLLRMADSSYRTQLLEAIAADAKIVTLAIAEPSRTEVTEDGLNVDSDLAEGPQALISGAKSLILHADQADTILVQIGAGPDTALCVVDAKRHAATFEISRLVTPDMTRRLDHLEFHRTPAIRLEGMAEKAVEATLNRAHLAIAAEALGGMNACLDRTVEYAKIRYAFGHPIGSYQGVKHPLADNKLAVELGYSLLLDALAQLDLDETAFVRAVLAARSFLGAAYIKSAYDMMQLHGGIGYTWEHVAHLYYKRAAFGDLLFGGVDRQLDALGELLLADARGSRPNPVH
jgi:alkylation response protein AidB-like acyl-CoA dehydrogenase